MLYELGKVRPYVWYAYIIFPYVNCTLTSLYDENQLRVSYLQPKFTKVTTECVIDSHKCKQLKKI